MPIPAHHTHSILWLPSYLYLPSLLVCHGSELPFVFNVFTDGASISYTPTSSEVQLTQEVTTAWSSFVKAGNPNGGGLPYSYPAYDQAGDKVLVLDEPGEYVGQEVRDAYCDLWDELGYYY
ncbi:hypothetical protein EON65_47240 [archaeon]|nr:MAG: hypothetical protein EON65_47240 [archaeon]